MNAIDTTLPWQRGWLPPFKQWLKGTWHRKQDSTSLRRICMGSYTWDYADNTLRLDSKLLAILGFSRHNLVFIEPKNWLEMISAEDIPVVIRKARKCANGENAFFHCRVTAFNKHKAPLCITLHGRADHQNRTISGSFLVLNPDFIY
ncbi:hypothetical protein [Olivibacter sp. XZL3]|uniref:hypothetical protein n=1 Tax=Olivibacter sp. XZL3 TaxID=1735116 RepID=UPI001065464E|nr:hypothetical protein [Olivibacter sp. XZL3]